MNSLILLQLHVQVVMKSFGGKSVKATIITKKVFHPFFSEFSLICIMLSKNKQTRHFKISYFSENIYGLLENFFPLIFFFFRMQLTFCGIHE